MNPFTFIGKKLSALFSQRNKKFKLFQKQTHLDRQLVVSLNRRKIPNLKQFKYLPKVLSSREKRQAQALILIIAVCLIFLVIDSYLLLTVAIPKVGGEYVEALIGSPRFINPILAQTNDVDLDLSKLIFSGLMKYDKNQQLIPDLADSYEISPDQLTYTFHLKKKVKWQDGEKFTAADVIFTIASIQDPEFKSPLDAGFRGVTAEKVDDYTIKLILKEPFAPFLSMLTFGILPEHLWYNIPPANADLTELNKKPVGTGPWSVDNFKKDKTGLIKSYTLVINPDYYGSRPYLDKLVFKFYGDYFSAIDALKNRSVSGIAYLPLEYKDELKKQKNINYFGLKQPQYTAIFFNQNKNELLKSDYIRQALALSLDKKTIVEQNLGSDAELIDEPTLPTIPDNPDIAHYSYDPEGAAALLEKNGWQLTSTSTGGLTEQIRKKKNWYLTITLTTVDQPQNVAIAKMIKSYWDRIGVQTNLEIVDKSKIIQDTINNRNYEALLFGENFGADPDPFPFWHSSQNEYPGLNLAIFSDKKVDDLLEKARKTNNWEERKNYYWEFQKIIAQALPVVFLFTPTYIYPQDNKIKGFDINSIFLPADRFANLNEWYINTKRVWKK